MVSYGTGFNTGCTAEFFQEIRDLYKETDREFQDTDRNFHGEEIRGQVNNACWFQTLPGFSYSPPTLAFAGFMLTLTYLVGRFLPRFCSDSADPGPI